MERAQEIATWEHKKVDLEQTVAKFKKIVNFNLSNHKEATDRLRQLLQESEGRNLAKDDENKQL